MQHTVNMHKWSIMKKNQAFKSLSFSKMVHFDLDFSIPDNLNYAQSYQKHWHFIIIIIIDNNYYYFNGFFSLLHSHLASPPNQPQQLVQPANTTS